MTDRDGPRGTIEWMGVLAQVGAMVLGIHLVMGWLGGETRPWQDWAGCGLLFLASISFCLIAILQRLHRT